MGEGLDLPNQKRYVDHRDQIPKFLFRYRAANTKYFLEEVGQLDSSKIYLAPAQYLNDPYDCQPRNNNLSYSEFRAEIRKFGRNKYFRCRQKELEDDLRWKSVDLSNEHNATKFKRKFGSAELVIRHDYDISKSLMADTEFRNFRVASFSCSAYNPILWAHYANNYSGICIKYRVSEYIISEDSPYIPLAVHYSEDRPVITNIDFVKLLATEFFTEPNEPEHDVSTADYNIMRKLMLSKSEAWSYEQEYRLALPSYMPATYHYFPSLIPESIIVGSRTPEEITDKIRDMTSIPLDRLLLSDITYELSSTNGP